MKPNIVVIVLDALRADRVGALGGRDLTPNIDSIAKNAAVFNNAFTTSNATDAAVTSLQTGRYPLSSGLVNHGRRVTDQEKARIGAVTLLPEVLREAGYRTEKIGRPLGRWHRSGFQHYPEAMENQLSMDKREKHGQKRPMSREERIKRSLGDALESIHPRARQLAAQIYHIGVGPITDAARRGASVEENNTHDEVVEAFTSFINGPIPFYAFVHLMDVHRYNAPPNRVRACLNRFDYSTGIAGAAASNISNDFQTMVSEGEFPEIEEKYYSPDGEPTTAIIDAHYDATVSIADERTGALISALEDDGSLDDTVVVILSDHGESLTEHGIYYDHHGLYDVSTHIPLIIKPPGGEKREISEFVQITDVAPTIESYAGTSELDADGCSLRPVIKGEGAVGRQYVMAEEAHTQRRRMVRSHDSKLIQIVEGDTICRYCDVQHAPATEFYDLKTDPEEVRNLASEELDEMAEFQDHASRVERECSNKRPDRDDAIAYADEEEIYERLDALGYR